MGRDEITANELTADARRVISGARANTRLVAIDPLIEAELRRRGLALPAPAGESITRTAVVTRRGARVGRVVAEQEAAESEGHGYYGDGVHGCEILLGSGPVRCGAGRNLHPYDDDRQAGGYPGTGDVV